MKQSPQDRALQERLGPSKFSAEGFLGSDLRTVGSIVADDSRVCDEAGISIAQIADALAHAYTLAERGPGGPVPVSLRCTAQLHEAKGVISSPFPGERTFPKGEVVLTDTPTGRTVKITMLSIHLVRTHGFFQGIGARYRIDPALIIAMLELVPAKADS